MTHESDHDQPNILSKSTTERLLEVIYKLSEAQREYLITVIKDWIKDKREFPRTDCNADIIYSDSTRLAQGFVVNISPGGLFIEPDSPFTIGQDLLLTFEHPIEKSPVKLEGKIIRTDKKGIAVQFAQKLKGLMPQQNIK